MRLMSGVRWAVALVTMWSLGSFAAVAATIPIYVVGASRPNVNRAVVLGGQVFVPIHGVVDRIGITPRYRYPDRVRFVRHGRLLASIVVGSRNAEVGGRPSALSVAPFTARGQIFVPLTFVTEKLGGDLVVGRDPLRVTVTPPLPAVAPPPPAVAEEPRAVAALPAGDRLAPLRIAIVAAVVAACAVVAGFAVWRERRRSEPLVVSETYDDAVNSP